MTLVDIGTLILEVSGLLSLATTLAAFFYDLAYRPDLDFLIELSEKIIPAVNRRLSPHRQVNLSKQVDA